MGGETGQVLPNQVLGGNPGPYPMSRTSENSYPYITYAMGSRYCEWATAHHLRCIFIDDMTLGYSYKVTENYTSPAITGLKNFNGIKNFSKVIINKLMINRKPDGHYRNSMQVSCRDTKGWISPHVSGESCIEKRRREP